MKYYKQWTLSETLFSAYLNIRKAFTDKYIVRADHGKVIIWTKEDNPTPVLVLLVEATSNASQQAFQELASVDGIRHFRLAGSSLSIEEQLKPYL